MYSVYVYVKRSDIPIPQFCHTYSHYQKGFPSPLSDAWWDSLRTECSATCGSSTRYQRRTSQAAQSLDSRCDTSRARVRLAMESHKVEPKSNSQTGLYHCHIDMKTAMVKSHFIVSFTWMRRRLFMVPKVRGRGVQWIR